MNEIVKQFPEWDGTGPFVGTRQYWEGVFASETNRNPALHLAWRKLHDHLVQEVIDFCREHDIKNVDEVHFHADGLQESIQKGRWEPWTDSSMSLVVTGPDGWPDRRRPFLFEA